MDKIHDPPSVTIRQPATANLMLDSADRNTNVYPFANNFQISKPQALLNGFFHRIGTTEVVLEWTTPNFLPQANNMAYELDISGVAPATGIGALVGTLATTYPTGIFLDCAAYAEIVLALLNQVGTQTAPATTWTIANPRPGVVQFVPNQAVAISLAGSFFTFGQLATTGYAFPTPADPIVWGQYPGPNGPILQSIRYLDFVSQQLTYNQDLKDASTAPLVRDVMCRWYMAYDQPADIDAYGFPIQMGYAPFILRRIYSPPKQIRWDNIQPIGNLAFEVYNDAGVIQPMDNGTNWLMTLQVSEN